MDVTIAVLITYHGEKGLLHECLKSLTNQGAAPDEILVYDDASGAPAQNFLPDGLAVTVLRGDENRGPAYGRNRLLGACKSAYVHFHDADDLFNPQWSVRVRRVLE